MGVLCSGTVGYTLWWYNQETKPDRSAPDVVASSFLRALLVERDDSQAVLYVCEDGAALNHIYALRKEIESREQRYQSRFRVSWGELRVSGEGQTRQVEVSLRLATTVDDFPQTDIQTWRLSIQNEGGWRVCGASRSA
ncbi:hypothetical protein JCM9534A_47130 [Catenuloplanes indicus JCM 9534]